MSNIIHVIFLPFLNCDVLPVSEPCIHSLTCIYKGDLFICLEDLKYFIMLSLQMLELSKGEKTQFHIDLVLLTKI